MAHTTFHLSDAHLVHQWDTPADELRKGKAIECIAELVTQTEGAVSMIWNGDIFHRPDDPAREGFRPDAAERAIAPLIDALVAKNATLAYLPGNCDPWAGVHAFHEQMRAIFDPKERLKRFAFVDGALEIENTLVTHGHAFEPSISMMLRETLPWPKPKVAQRRMGLKLVDLLDDPVATLADRNAHEWTGSHRKAYLINKTVDSLMYILLARLRKHLDSFKQSAMNRCYTKAACYGAAELLYKPDLIVMGHTHNCILLARSELQALLGKDIPLPKVFLNTGTVTGDRGKPATFGIQTKKSVQLMEIGSPSSKPAHVLREVSLTDE